MRLRLRPLLASLRALLAIGLAGAAPASADMTSTPEDGTIRVATFNAAMARRGAGRLLKGIRNSEAQVTAVAEIILRARPDVLLINELDADPEGLALAAFRKLLAEGVAGLDGLDYAAWAGPQNVGVFSGLDLDGDGVAAGPGDAWGFGRFPGQYAMAVLSRLPFEPTAIRSWQTFRWADMPDARRPTLPSGAAYHPDDVWQSLRLSSKAHWAVPLATASGPLWLVAAHPTPPVFDGPEDRNGRRNADEIRLIEAILDGADWLTDDRGQPGGLPADARFVVAGDLNADPEDGEAVHAAIRGLLAHPRLQDPQPASEGGRLAGQAEAARGTPKRGDTALHTADWPTGNGRPGNLRVDYVLPSTNLDLAGAGVFWPTPDDPLHKLVARSGRKLASSDHRLIWVDIRLP